MSIGLVSWVSFAEMLSTYLKSFEASEFGNKPDRFAIPELECSRVVISFLAAMLVLWALRNLYILHLYIYKLLVKFWFQLFIISYYRKSVLILVRLSEATLIKNRVS